MLGHWAAANGHELLSARLRPIVKGPYWYARNAQIAYRIAIRDAQGAERQGWVRCGGPPNGPPVDQVDVKWDSEKPRDAEESSELRRP